MKILAISMFCGLLLWDAAAHSKYPGRKLPACSVQPRIRDLFPSVISGANKAKISMTQHHTSESGVWNQQVLSTNKNLADALGEYSKNKRGLSVRNLRLADKTPEQVYGILLINGFHYNRMALGAVPQDIYAHPDGGMVRIKPEGFLGKYGTKVRRPQPHVSKSVLLNLKLVCSGQNVPCHMDTSLKNEGFKVTELGEPVPKTPSPEFGLKPLHLATKGMIEFAENRGWVDYIMSMAHSNLAFDFSHCNHR